MKKQCERGFLLATEMADYLARKGMAFRQAHSIVAKIVRDIRQKNGDENLEKLSLSELKSYSPLFGKDIYPYLNPLKNAQAKNSYGGTGQKSLSRQIQLLKSLIRKA